MQPQSILSSYCGLELSNSAESYMKHRDVFLHNETKYQGCLTRIRPEDCVTLFKISSNMHTSFIFLFFFFFLKINREGGSEPARLRPVAKYTSHPAVTAEADLKGKCSSRKGAWFRFVLVCSYVTFSCFAVILATAY